VFPESLHISMTCSSMARVDHLAGICLTCPAC
jgi:hypothetical protein